MKLTKTLGTRTVNELCDEGKVLIHSGSVVTVAEAVFTVPKPLEVQGHEDFWIQTVYLKSPEGYRYCWRYREPVRTLGSAALGGSALRVFGVSISHPRTRDRAQIGEDFEGWTLLV